METFAEAFKILLRSWKMMALLLLSVSALLAVQFLATYSIILHLKSLATNDILLVGMMGMGDNSPQLQSLFKGVAAGLRRLVGVAVLPAAIGVLTVDFLFLTATVYTSAVAYSCKKNIAASVLLRRVASSWRGTVITKLYSALVVTGYSAWFTCLVALALLVSSRSLLLLTVSVVLVALVGVPAGAYLILVAQVAVVVSVVAEHCYGFQALERASGVVCKRKKQALFIFIVPLVGVVSLVWLVTVSRFTAEMLFGGIVIILLTWVVQMFMLVIYTIFYLEDGTHHASKDYEMVSA